MTPAAARRQAYIVAKFTRLAQFPGLKGDMAREALTNLYNAQQAAKQEQQEQEQQEAAPAPVVAPRVSLTELAKQFPSRAARTPAVRHDFIDDKAIAAGRDWQGAEGTRDEKW